MRSTKLATLLMSAALLAGCAKDKDDPAPPSDGGGSGATDPSSITIDSDPVVLMTVDGSEKLIPVGANVFPLMGSSIEVGEPSTGAWTCGLYNSVIDLVLFEMRIGSLAFNGESPSAEEFLALLAPGPRAYGFALGGSDGVSIEWFDQDHNPWRSHCGTGDQSTSSFVITDAVQEGDEVKVRATFELKLYRCIGGDEALTVTSGVLVLPFRKD